MLPSFQNCPRPPLFSSPAAASLLLLKLQSDEVASVLRNAPKAFHLTQGKSQGPPGPTRLQVFWGSASPLWPDSPLVPPSSSCSDQSSFPVFPSRALLFSLAGNLCPLGPASSFLTSLQFFLRVAFLTMPASATLSKTSVLPLTLYVPSYPALCFSLEHLLVSNIPYTSYFSFIKIETPRKQWFPFTFSYCVPGACQRRPSISVK